MQPTSRSTHRSRGFALAGFALAELLVAATLLVVGLLAVAGTSSRLARAESDARADARAAATIAERVEIVASSRCRDSSGVVVQRDLTERWRTWNDTGLARLVDSVHYTSVRSPTGTRVVALDAAARCRP